MPTYFYPRSPCGERHTEIDLNGVADLFLSTLSLRRATAGAKATANATWNFYPRSPCGERRAYSLPSSTISTISIHALLAESDDADRAALCERCIFLSTLSLRRATTNIREGVTVLGVFLSTLSLRRATQALKRICGRYHKFLSTLSLRRATCAIVCIRCVRLFLSTLSLRRATSAMALNNDFRQISIHALLAESDTWEFLSQSMTCAFLSTLSLRRATLYGLCLPPVGKTFLSTLSLRRATEQSSSYNAYLEISIHALLAESDQ